MNTLSLVARRASAAIAAVTVALLCVAPAIAQDSIAQDTIAQPKLLVGLGIPFGALTAKTEMPVYDGDPACGVHEGAKGLLVMPSLVMRMPSLFAEPIGIALRFGYLIENTTATTVPVDPQRAVDPQTGALVDVTRELRLESSRGAVALDALASVTFDALSIAVGPSVWARIGGEESPRDVIVAPGGATFRGGARERDIIGATPLTQSSLGLDAVASIAYMLRIGKRAYLSPHVSTRISLSSAYSEYDRSAIAFLGGIDLLFDVTPPPAPPPPPIVIVVEPEPVVVREPTLTASLRSLDSNGDLVDAAAEVIYREVIERRHVPILPVVFFDSGSSRLPARARTYTVDTKPSDVTAVLADLGTVEAQAHVLNVVGERLRANPNLTIGLVGATSSDEPRAISEDRVDSVRNYLVDVWRINEQQVKSASGGTGVRMSSESTPEGREENRRVQITASDASVFRAVTVERRIGQAVVPVRLAHTIRASEPVLMWTARLTGKDSDVIRIDTGRGEELSITLDPDDLDRQTTTLNAAYRAEFSDGRTMKASSSIPVVWLREQTFLEGTTVRDADREVTTWQILGFGFDSPELLDRHRNDVRAIASLVRDGATIVVTGYSDRLGEAQRNITLSRERADAVASQLRSELLRRSTSASSVSASGAGVDESRFSNDLPEGRMLSRGVTVSVEQSVR